MDPGPEVEAVTVTETHVQYNVTNAREDDPLELALPESMTAGSGVEVDALTVTMSRDLPSFEIHVRTYTERPENVSLVTGADDLPLYLELDVDRGLGRYIDEATVDLSLAKDDLDARQSAPENVALYRYHDEAWERLETRQVNERDGRYVLRATSPGASYFALGIQQPVASVSNVTAERDVALGDTAPVTATVSNVGSADGTVVVDLTVDGDVVASRSLSLESGANTTVTFDHRYESPGTYAVEIGGQRVDTVVREAKADVSLMQVTADARTVGPGENVTLIATFTNWGAFDGTATVTYGIADGATRTQTVSVASGETKVVTLDQRLASPGAYTLFVNDLVVDVTVEEGSSKLDTPAVDADESVEPDSEERSTGVPYGVLPFVLGGVLVLGVGLWMMRR